jgi:hypothetical protein
MKTKFKTHIKYDSCWYDNFFKTNKTIKIIESKRKQLNTIKNENKT